MSEDLFQSMTWAIIGGDTGQATALANRVVALGIPPMDAINKGFLAGVNIIGEQFACGAAFLPELVMAGEAMKAAIDILETEMAKTGTTRNVLGKVVIGTVEGDIHDIGKTLVAVMLSVGGFQVYDLGTNVAVGALIDKAKEVDADIIAVSALLTTTMTRQRDVVEALEDRALRPKIKVMVGGAPVTRAWAQEIGADGYSEDAVGAVQIARQLVSPTRGANPEA